MSSIHLKRLLWTPWDRTNWPLQRGGHWKKNSIRGIYCHWKKDSIRGIIENVRFQKIYPYPPQGGLDIWKFQADREVSKGQNVLKEKVWTKTVINFQRDEWGVGKRGIQTKKSLCGRGMDFCWNNTKYRSVQGCNKLIKERAISLLQVGGSLRGNSTVLRWLKTFTSTFQDLVFRQVYVSKIHPLL